MRIEREGPLQESILLLAVFFLPGILFQGPPGEALRGVGTPYFLRGVVVGLPQLLLLLYVLRLNPDMDLRRFGIVRPRFSDIVRALILATVLVALAALLHLLSTLLPSSSPEGWSLAAAADIPAALVFVLVGAYREELFFRCYLLERLPQGGIPVWAAATVSSVLFASAHLYEGPMAVAFAAAQGVLFSAVFLKNRSIHTLGLAHALYNALVLILS